MALPWPGAQAAHGLLTSQNAHFWLPVTPVPLSVCRPAGSPAARVLRVPLPPMQTATSSRTIVLAVPLGECGERAVDPALHGVG